MKPGPKSKTELEPLVAFGAHPDDIEFGCGAVVAKEVRNGRPVHMVICSKGESATHGTPEQRVAEARLAGEILGAEIQFIELDGDGHFTVRPENAIALAAIIRRVRPGILLAPSCVENQHPDHWRLGQLVRDAARLARYGGLAELRDLAPHAIRQLHFYAVTPEAEPRDVTPLLIDVSDPAVVAAWKAAMEAHGSQTSARNYVELQMTRARLLGVRAGIEYAMALYPNDPPVLESLSQIARGARRF